MEMGGSENALGITSQGPLEEAVRCVWGNSVVGDGRIIPGVSGEAPPEHDSSKASIPKLHDGQLNDCL